jgi:hypothetical protein
MNDIRRHIQLHIPDITRTVRQIAALNSPPPKGMLYKRKQSHRTPIIIVTYTRLEQLRGNIHTNGARKYCGVFTPCNNCNLETRSRDYATVDEAVFSPCRAEPHRATAVDAWMTQEWGWVT